MVIRDSDRAQWTRQMNAAAAPLGISFMADRRMYNSIASHRLFEYVKTTYSTDTMDKVTDQIFKAYFSEGKDISDTDLLVECVTSSGVDGEKVRELLSNPDMEPSVSLILEKDSRVKSEMDVSGVPFFIFNNHMALSGAQEPATFLQVFRKLKERNIVYEK